MSDGRGLVVGVTPFVDVVEGGVVGEGQPGLGAYCSCWMCLGATPLEDPLFAAWGVSAPLRITL